MKWSCTFFLLAVLIIASCNSNPTNKSNEFPDKKNVDSIINKFEVLSNDSLSALLFRTRNFAEKYKPVSNSELGPAFLTNIPDSIVNSFRELRVQGNQEYVKYLTLILVKVYLTHLKCCHQGYELRNKNHGIGIDSVVDPLIYEFNLISKTFDNSNRIEFINSGFWQQWLKENLQLLEYDELEKEYQELEKINAGILIDPNKYY